MLFEICAALAVLTFIVLVVYIIQTLKEVQTSLKSTRATLANLEIELLLIKTEVMPLIQNSNELIAKINAKVDDVDPLFKAVSKIGNTMLDASHLFEKKTMRLLGSEERKFNWSEKILDVIELAGLGIKMFQQIKKGK